MRCCMYLRKSRSDLTAGMSAEETLLRHEKALRELAQRMQLEIGAVYREVVSGETISGRPMMKRLLSEVEQCKWDGVLVMEIERLARGNTVDQGIITQTFHYAKTKIITPNKIYSPEDEFDEEYFEFSLFMSRREYKAINRRMQRGRVASVKEGKFVGSVPPYGYQKVKLKNEKGYTLTLKDEQADIVRRIFDSYTVRRISAKQIAWELNRDGFLTAKNNIWKQNAVLDILKNPVYCGKIRWNNRKLHRTTAMGEPVSHRPRSSPEEILLTDGLHPAIISQEQFDTAQERRQSKK